MKLIVAWALPATANPIVGAPGTVAAGGGGVAIKFPKAAAPNPTVTLSTIVLVAVAITATLPGKLTATYARAPSGLMATPIGWVPTVTVASTTSVVVSMTETALPLYFVT